MTASSGSHGCFERLIIPQAALSGLLNPDKPPALPVVTDFCTQSTLMAKQESMPSVAGDKKFCIRKKKVQY